MNGLYILIIRLFEVQIIFYTEEATEMAEEPELTCQQIVPAIANAPVLRQKLPPLKLSVKQMGGSCAFQCRVCLEGDGELIRPCACSGSLEFIHKRCLQQWLTARYEKCEDKSQFDGGLGVFCEVCHSAYLVLLDFHHEWRSYSQIASLMRANRFSAIAHILFILLGISSLILFSISAHQSSRKREDNANEMRLVFIYLSIVATILAILFGVYQFVKTFMLLYKIQITPQKQAIMVRKNSIVLGKEPSIQGKIENRQSLYRGF